MNRVSAWILPALLLAASSCGPDQAAQLLDTAQFEERQTNKAHAKELYEEIIRHYPDSPAAKTARTRLAELDKP
jgi:TolA-binding protein